MSASVSHGRKVNLFVSHISRMHLLLKQELNTSAILRRLSTPKLKREREGVRKDEDLQ